MSNSISIIVPVYNAEKYVAAALDSVLRQGVPLLEIVVVDDGSTDGSWRVVQEWASRNESQVTIQLIQQTNAGPGAARNSGITACRGHWVGFLDADDLFPAGGLLRGVELHRQKGGGVVQGMTQAFSSLGEQPETLSEPFRFLNVGSAVFGRNVFDEVGLFNPEMRGSEDVDWFLRARDCGVPLHAHDGVALWHRRHGANMTDGQSLQALDFHRALKSSLDRRRKSGAMNVPAPFERPEE